jgi:hypothetical protein
MVDVQTLTLLDQAGLYLWYNSRFDSRIFVRFNDHEPCLAHLQAYIPSNNIDLHFFLPASHCALIVSTPLDADHMKNYVYCRDKDSIHSIRATYGRRVAHKLILEEDLEFEMAHTEISLLFALMKQAPAESIERDEIATSATSELEILSHLFRQQIASQLGIEASDHN